ncbi:MAG: site-specific tyrosine recombinase XerD [Lachnospiraceae bacterium]
MIDVIQKFVTYLQKTKKTSTNTIISYERDLKKMLRYFETQNIHEVFQVTGIGLTSYVMYLEKENFATSTISRNIASIRAFFHWLEGKKLIDNDPSQELKPPKVIKKAPEILTVEEVNRLLLQPREDTAKGIRDRCMMEILYATGIRVSELVNLQTTDANLQMEYIRCGQDGRERIIPFGSLCRKSLKKYMEDSRTELLGKNECKELFINCSGKSMSRQGFWKVLKSYSSEAHITKDITPHTLRHSFAAHLIQNGADVKSVQEMLGHSDISSTQMYLNLGNQKMREVYSKSHPRK